EIQERHLGARAARRKHLARQVSHAHRIRSRIFSRPCGLEAAVVTNVSEEASPRRADERIVTTVGILMEVVPASVRGSPPARPRGWLARGLPESGLRAVGVRANQIV